MLSRTLDQPIPKLTTYPNPQPCHTNSTARLGKKVVDSIVTNYYIRHQYGTLQRARGPWDRYCTRYPCSAEPDGEDPVLQSLALSGEGKKGVGRNFEGNVCV